MPILQAMTEKKNIGFSVAVLIIYFFSRWEPLIFIALAMYTLRTIRLITDPEFKEKCLYEQRTKRLKKLNNKVNLQFYRLKVKVGTKTFKEKVIDKISNLLGVNPLPNIETRVLAVENIKNDILNTFAAREFSPLREKIAQKALELTEVYFKLMDLYTTRLYDVSGRNFEVIQARLERNRQKRNLGEGRGIARELETAIESDKKLLNKLKEEKKEVEKMAARLDVIESNMLLFKQHMFAEDQNEEMIEGIEETINESVALDNALHEHNKHTKRNRLG